MPPAAAGNDRPSKRSPRRRRTPVEEPQPLPAPVVREPTLGAASRALVGQAQTQLASKNYRGRRLVDRTRVAHRARQSAAVDRAGQSASGRRQLRAGGKHGPQGAVDVRQCAARAIRCLAPDRGVLRARGKNIEAQRSAERAPSVDAEQARRRCFAQSIAAARVTLAIARVARCKIRQELSRRRIPGVRERIRTTLLRDRAAAPLAPPRADLR